MARIMPREYFINVETFSELFTLENLSNNMDITVNDASGDVRTNGGTVIYTYVASKSGVEAFIPSAKENEELVVVEQESLTIQNGKVTLQYTPSNGVIFDVVVRWVDEEANSVSEDVIYTLSAKDVLIDPAYNGKTLSCKYLRNDSGKLVSTVVQDGHLHTHDNKDFLDTIYAIKTINGTDIRGVGDIVIGGATSGYGLSVDSNGAFAVDSAVIATMEYVNNIDLIIDYSELTGVPSTFAPSTHNHSISEVSGLQLELDSKANNSDVQALSALMSTDSERLSAIQAVTDAFIAADDSLEGTITSLANAKVDKVVGKGLSTEDYATAEKTKLSGIATGAQVNTISSVAGKTGIVTLVKGDVGLGSVDNTADLLKPISTATQTALNLKANLASPTFTGTVSGITKAMVNLSNVDNTTDLLKPISTATQTALNGKVDESQVLTNVPAGAVFTDTVYTHPTNHPASVITQDASNRFVTDIEKTTWNAKASTTVVTTSVNGLMASADKTKLDGLSNYVKPSSEAISYISNLQTTLDSKATTTALNTEKSRIDAILLASGTNVDTFAEVVSLINSVDTTNDSAFAGYVLGNDAVVDSKANKDFSNVSSFPASVVLQLKGDTGLTGPTGIQGIKGDTGLTGAAGIQGIKGDTGAAGSNGLKGDTGLTGLTGAAGSNGLKGDTGAQGATGLKGDTGLTGANGLDGNDGIQGLKGDTGANGIQGLTGPAGTNGATGPAGTDASVTELSITSVLGFTPVSADAVDTAIQSVIGAAPAALDTLKEIADQLANDESAASALTVVVGSKVDKVTGKQLSTEDYTTTEKNKLAGLSSYTLPVASTTVLGGVKAGMNIVIDANGVISANDASVAWSEVTSKPTFATVATTGSYTDLLDKPVVDLSGYYTKVELGTLAEFEGAL